MTLAHPDVDKDNLLVAVEKDEKFSKAHFNFASVGSPKFVSASAAEQNMVCVAQGIAVRGKIPFCSAESANFTRFKQFITASAV